MNDRMRGTRGTAASIALLACVACGDSFVSGTTAGSSSSSSSSSSASAGGGASVSSSNSAGGTGGAVGSGGQGGSGGEDVPACGNGVVDPGELCFGSVEPHPLGAKHAQSIALLDCDGDLDQDIVAVANTSASIVVLRNNGSGAFTSVVASATLDRPACVAVGNVDDDAELEVVTAHDGTSVQQAFVIHNHGAGACQYVAGEPIPLSGPATGLALGDVNDDGKRDIVGLVNAGSGTDFLAVYLSGNTPTLSEQELGIVQPLGLALADVDRDQLSDAIYTSSNAAKAYVRPSNGSEFGDEIEAPFGETLGTGPRAVAVGDLDGDQNLDMVTANFSAHTLSVVLGDGTGYTLAGPDLELGQRGAALVPQQPQGVALGDLDGDGDLDIVCANAKYSSANPSSISLFVNDGDANFALATAMTVPILQAEFPLEVGPEPFAVAIGDVNGDGAPDIITGHVEVTGGESYINVMLAAP